MKRFIFKKKGKETLEFDSIEDIAGHFRCLETSVQAFVSKNKKGQLTFKGYDCQDNNKALQEAKDKETENRIREEIFQEAKLELEQAAKDQAKAVTEGEAPKRTTRKTTTKA